MKCIMPLISVLFVFNSNAQTVQNEKVFYHYNKMPSAIHFTSNPKLIISTAGLESDYIWNIDQENEKTEIKTYRYGESMMNANGTELCTVGGQYYDKETKELSSSSLSFYSVEQNQTTVKKFQNLDLLRMCYHPTDKNSIAIIGMDEDFNYRAALMNRETFELSTVVFRGKGAVMPLWQQFSPDGKYLFIGYGNSSYNGGYTVYDISAKKEIKRISLKDQPKEFIFLADGRFIMKGNRSVIIYNKDFTQISKHDLNLAAIHPSGQYGIHFNINKEAYFYHFASKTKTKLDIPILQKEDLSNAAEFYGNAKFSPDGKSLGIIFFKWHSNKAATVNTLPSFMVYDITQS